MFNKLKLIIENCTPFNLTMTVHFRLVQTLIGSGDQQHVASLICIEYCGILRYMRTPSDKVINNELMISFSFSPFRYST